MIQTNFLERKSRVEQKGYAQSKYTKASKIGQESIESFEFCFDGLPKDATLSISTIGVKRDKELYFIWKNGVDTMIDMLSPKRLIIYGGKIEYDYPKDLEVVYIENSVTERMNQNGR